MNTFQTTPSCHNEMVECEWEAVEALACLSHTREQAIDIQSEDESELKTSSQCDLTYPPVTSSKVRQESTEEEKEGQRLRRVLANRESARRTIRRKQAMQEELTRKAADLALENENLKKNKELAAAVYNSLKNKNNSLKAQVAKTVEAEVQTNDESSMLPTVEIPTTSTTSQTFLHNQSSTAPFFISTVFQPLDGLLLQSGSQSISATTPQLPTPLGEFKRSHKAESAMMMNKPGTPLYVLSFPWTMPFRTQSNLFHTHSSNHNDQHQTSFLHGYSTSISQTTVNVENHLKAAPLKVETETTDSIGTMHRDFLHEAESDFQSDEGASKGMIHETATSSPFVRPVIGRQSETQQDNTPNVKDFAHAARLAVDSSTQIYQGCVTCSSNSSADAIVAAEARKRRKELLKLKSQHCHPFRVI